MTKWMTCGEFGNGGRKEVGGDIFQEYLKNGG
jgi:hypothetical protein